MWNGSDFQYIIIIGMFFSILGQPYAGAPAQRVGSAPLRKMGSCQATHTVRGNGSLANKSVSR